jgi:ABC-type proline/glycine betaine transport system substrate-binding protein
MSKLVDVDKMEVQDAATKWMDDNDAKWRAWLN